MPLKMMLKECHYGHNVIETDVERIAVTHSALKTGVERIAL